ncbi:MAG: DUF2283 domain-containing protein [archaeon]
MRIEYDKESDSVYVYFKEIEAGEVVQTISLNDSVNIDVDKDGKTLGIEILDVKKILPTSAVESLSLC